MTHPWFRASAAPRVLAHRGLVPADAEGVAENTLAAFAAAHAAGATYVESDCHLTADGEVILFHDLDLARIAGDPRLVADIRLRELKEIMGTRGGLLTLAEALDAFPTLRFNLDVKVDAVAAPVGHIAAEHSDRVLLTSFSDARRRVALGAARSGGADPATSAGSRTIARVLGAVASRSPRLARRSLAGIDALQVPERHRGIRIVTPRLLDVAHRAGVEVHVWTVNDADDMGRLLDMGVDGLVTDRAETALDVISRRA